MPPPTPTDPVIISLALYTWPFLFAAVTGLIVWIWKERVFERGVNIVRANFSQAMQSHRELQEGTTNRLDERIAALERTVDGVEKGNGLRSDMKKVKHGIRALLLMRLEGDAGGEGMDAKDVKLLMAELE